jgi:hypothetical protein
MPGRLHTLMSDPHVSRVCAGDTFDRDLAGKLEAAGGDKYATLTQLTYLLYSGETY